MTQLTRAHPSYAPPAPPSQEAPKLAAWLHTQLASVARALLPRTVRTITANATLAVTDDVVLVDATAGAITVTLLPAARSQFWRGTIKKIDSSVHAVTITPSGTDKIDGASSKSLASQWNALTIQNNGVAYYTLASV